LALKYRFIDVRKPKDLATDYAEKVGAGRIVAGPHVRDACARHLHDLKNGPKRGLRWDEEAADRACRFFPAVLRLNGGQFEGKPFALQPSQAFTVGSLFGWKRADGTRRFRRAYIEEAKGSGKSPLAAGIGMYCLVADGEARAEVYAAATKRDQAMILFRDAVAMFQQSPWLSKRLTPSGGNPVWNLADLQTGSFFRPISSDEGQSGPRPSCALCDEIHEHRDGRIIEMLERGFKWRRQPLLLMITNAGSDRGSVCWEEHQFAIRVAAGEVEHDRGDVAFSYVCALDEDDDPLEDEGCWIKANPLLGVTVTKEYLREVASQAKAIPGKMNNIIRLHFCTWTDAERAWMPRETLRQVFVGDPDAEDGEAETLAFTGPLEGKDVHVGVDLSGSQDLTSAAFVVETGKVEVERTKPDGSKVVVTAPTFDAWVESWTPGDTMVERAIRDSAQYDVWARRGWLRAPPGRNIRLDFVAAYMAEVSARFRIVRIAYDRYSFRKFEDELDAIGLTVPCLEHPQGGKKRGAVPPEMALRAKQQKREIQGLWMPGSLIMLETLIFERRIRILANPAMVTAANAVAMEEDPYGNRWFSKRRATGRIDPTVALAQAVGSATMQVGKPVDINQFLQNAVVV
jgi:phage terminase large subunit-like protein